MKLFITGTDTEIGKTYIGSGLLRAASRHGLSTIGFKPVASGCDIVNGKLLNDDALKLQQAASQNLAYDLVNPLTFEEAVAPHIIAEQRGLPFSVAQLKELSAPTLQLQSDITLIEGFGGWHAPLNDTETMADFVMAMQFNVVLVVGVRLGCINHSLLTAEAFKHAGINCLGWIANCIDPDMPYAQENIEMIAKHVSFPLLGTVNYGVKPEAVLGEAINRISCSVRHFV